MVRFFKARICVEVTPAVAAVITHSPVVDFQILTRHQALDEAVKGFDLNVATSRAATADGRGFVHVPNSGFVFEVTGDQRANGADINGVPGE